jgi:hypothetical protein
MRPTTKAIKSAAALAATYATGFMKRRVTCLMFDV